MVEKSETKIQDWSYQDFMENSRLVISVERFLAVAKGRDCCAKFATGICIIVNSAFSFNFLTKFDYKHLK